MFKDSLCSDNQWPCKFPHATIHWPIGSSLNLGMEFVRPLICILFNRSKVFQANALSNGSIQGLSQCRQCCVIKLHDRSLSCSSCCISEVHVLEIPTTRMHCKFPTSVPNLNKVLLGNSCATTSCSHALLRFSIMVAPFPQSAYSQG